MKKLILTTIIVIVHSVVFAQIGIFKTYNDFENNNVVEYHGHHSTYHALGKFKVVFLDENDEKIKIDIDKENMWGYRSGKRIYRISDKNMPYVIIVLGKITVYGNYATKINDGKADLSGSLTLPLVSLGPNGEMLSLSKQKLKKLLKGDEYSLQKLKKTKSDYQSLVDFVLEYNG